MSILDDILGKGKQYLTEFTDKEIAEIKDYMGRYNTFEKKILMLKKEIESGSYSNDVISRYNEILDRQKRLDEQCQTFLKMTDTVASDFSDVKFDYDYIKSKFSKINEVVAVVYQFFTETKPLIDKQEQEIEDTWQLIYGVSATRLEVVNFVKKHWLISSIVGIYVIKKFLK